MKSSNLLKEAFLAQKKSQSKYSDFAVGCALLTDDNQIIPGCNIESAAYPSTMCAERVAIYAAISRGVTKFKSIAIVSPLGAKPCGSCRQIIHEYLGDIPIYVSNGIDNDYETHTIKELLPYPFG